MSINDEAILYSLTEFKKIKEIYFKPADLIYDIKLKYIPRFGTLLVALYE